MCVKVICFFFSFAHKAGFLLCSVRACTGPHTHGYSIAEGHATGKWVFFFTISLNKNNFSILNLATPSV